MNFDELTNDDLLTVRVKCDASLLYFTRFWFRVLKGTKFIVNSHHEVICQELESLERYELELLNINIPPRFSKTEIGAVNFIARGIGMNPTSNWLYITASDELRAQTSVSIRDIVQHPYFYKMYGVQLKKDQNGKNLWRTTKGGGLKTATIFGQVTGFGAGQMTDHENELNDYVRSFEGCIVLDDVNKIDDSGQMNAMNEKVTRVIFNTILSRKNSKDTPIINIQQRAGISDATANFMDHYQGNEKAKFLVMPVISSDGVPLWEWKHDLKDIERLRTSEATKSVFQTQYMQEPVNVLGLLMPIGNIRFGVKLENEIGRFCYIDPANKGGDNLGAIFFYAHEVEGRINVFVLDAIYSKAGIEENAPVIADKLREYMIDECYIESNGVGIGMVMALKNIIENKKILRPVSTNQNKEAKILQHYEFALENFIFDEKLRNSSYMKDLSNYEKEGNNTHKKDAMDVTCMAVEVIKLKFHKIIYK